MAWADALLALLAVHLTWQSVEVVCRTLLPALPSQPGLCWRNPAFAGSHGSSSVTLLTLLVLACSCLRFPMPCASARMLVGLNFRRNDDFVQTALNWGSGFVFVFFQDRVSLGSSRASNPLCSSCLSFPSAGLTGVSTMHLKVFRSSISAVWKGKSPALSPVD